MRRAFPVAVALLVCMGATSVVAQTDCSDVLEKKGNVAYEQCLRDEEETRIQQQVEDQTEEFDIRSERIADYYQQLRDEADFQWTAVDLAFKRQLSDEKYRLQDLQRNKSDENAEAIVRQQARMKEIEKERKFLSSSKDKYKRVLSDQEKLEMTQMEYQLAELELRLRGFTRFSDVIYGRY